LYAKRINEGITLDGQSWKTSFTPVFLHGEQKIELFLSAGFDENQKGYLRTPTLKAFTSGYSLPAGLEAFYIDIGFHIEGLLRRPPSFLQSTLKL
jgi:hypothetical protein